MINVSSIDRVLAFSIHIVAVHSKHCPSPIILAPSATEAALLFARFFPLPLSLRSSFISPLEPIILCPPGHHRHRIRPAIASIYGTVNKSQQHRLADPSAAVSPRPLPRNPYPRLAFVSNLSRSRFLREMPADPTVSPCSRVLFISLLSS